MRIGKLTVAASAALLLTACGGSPLDGKSGPEVAEAAAAALEEAGSVHVTGTIEQGGEEGDVDLHLQGSDAIGTLTMNGVDIELISVGGDAFLKAPGDFWGSFGMPSEATSMFEDQWILVPGDAAAEFAEFSLDGFVDELRDPESPVQDDVEEGEVDGEAVVIVTQEDGSELAVANDDDAYPLEITNKGDSPGTLRFSRFGEKEDIEAPADAIDLMEMMGGS
ncbi:hypothetical protein [Blastococcus sp. PRF04-17]|uniref:hypothetical protein n=1 Tax=Blastococcus sp. PRF04-17 TaxID=2933797 RepID=UPI001FF5DA1E|nr:hypothetical protein [Blastococcus sp. PRF04-17]UOY00683.1 hypothetical protein MVA48_17055 [Blastococcus sp. PRF04-17]